MNGKPESANVGTLLRHTLDLLDGDVARVYVDLGLPAYRPRYSPVVRTLLTDGPMSIRDLARRLGVTHSAASQTVNQMVRGGLLALTTGADSRKRIAALTSRTVELLPVIEAEWEATAAAMKELDAEVSVPLADLLVQIGQALGRRSFRRRIADQMRLPRPES